MHEGVDKGLRIPDFRLRLRAAAAARYQQADDDGERPEAGQAANSVS
jgi:hypothetical protein